jgi:cold shock CspA family protein
MALIKGERMIDTKIQFLNFDESESVGKTIQSHLETLEKITNRITSCHVVISRPHRKQLKGNIFHVKLRVQLPGATIVIDKDPGKNQAHQDVYVAVRDAFWAAKRKVEDYVRKQSGFVKEKVASPHAKIIRLIPSDECGFIQTRDLREIYFHRNSIVNGNFDDLSVGQEVRFSESMGEQGPQVTSMHIIRHFGKNGEIAAGT